MTKLLLLAALVATGVRSHAGLERPATEADLLRAYALAQCLAKSAEKTPFAEDAQRSGDLYLQGGKARGDAYEKVQEAIPENLVKPTPYEGKTIAVFRCIEWYESQKLKAMTRRLASGSQ